MYVGTDGKITHKANLYLFQMCRIWLQVYQVSIKGSRPFLLCKKRSWNEIFKDSMLWCGKMTSKIADCLQFRSRLFAIQVITRSLKRQMPLWGLLQKISYAVAVTRLEIVCSVSDVYFDKCAVMEARCQATLSCFSSRILDGSNEMSQSYPWLWQSGPLFTKPLDVLPWRSREVSKSRDTGLDFFNCSEIWQAPRQQRCRDACQISVRNDHYNTQSRGFETSLDLAVRRLPA